MEAALKAFHAFAQLRCGNIGYWEFQDSPTPILGAGGELEKRI